MTLQLRVGGKYKTRDGENVTITGTIGRSDFAWLGSNGHTYLANGRWHTAVEWGYDLVSEVLPDTTTPAYIHPGALVQLRDGTKARVYVTDAGGDFPVHGATWDADEACWEPGTWALSGKYTGERGDPVDDIVGPWVEPPVEVVRWAVYDAKGNYYTCYTQQNNAETNAFITRGTVIKLTGTLPTRDK